MSKILNKLQISQVKNLRATYAPVEKEIKKLKASVDKYNKLVENYALTRKSFEETFLGGVSALDVVVLKDENGGAQKTNLVENPLGVNSEGKFDLDLLVYNLEHKTNYKVIPTEETKAEQVKEKEEPRTEEPEPETEF